MNAKQNQLITQELLFWVTDTLKESSLGDHFSSWIKFLKCSSWISVCTRNAAPQFSRCLLAVLSFLWGTERTTNTCSEANLEGFQKYKHRKKIQRRQYCYWKSLFKKGSVLGYGSCNCQKQVTFEVHPFHRTVTVYGEESAEAVAFLVCNFKL